MSRGRNVRFGEVVDDVGLELVGQVLLPRDERLVDLFLERLDVFGVVPGFRRPGLGVDVVGGALALAPVFQHPLGDGHWRVLGLARAGERHQVAVVTRVGRVVAAVVAPVAEHRAPPLGPLHRARVGGQPRERPLLRPRPRHARDLQRGRDVVVAVELHRLGKLHRRRLPRLEGDLLVLLGFFRAVVAARRDVDGSGLGDRRAIRQRGRIARHFRGGPDVAELVGGPREAHRGLAQRHGVDVHRRRQAALVVAVADRVGVTAIEVYLLGQLDLDHVHVGKRRQLCRVEWDFDEPQVCALAVARG